MSNNKNNMSNTICRMLNMMSNMSNSMLYVERYVVYVEQNCRTCRTICRTNWPRLWFPYQHPICGELVEMLNKLVEMSCFLLRHRNIIMRHRHVLHICRKTLHAPLNSGSNVGALEPCIGHGDGTSPDVHEHLRKCNTSTGPPCGAQEM